MKIAYFLIQIKKFTPFYCLTYVAACIIVDHCKVKMLPYSGARCTKLKLAFHSIVAINIYKSPFSKQ